MPVSKRQAREKMRMFEALAAYANMGDTPDRWKRFHLQYPDFFPAELTAWMFDYANDWYRIHVHDKPAPPAYVTQTIPPLLWYRNRLRSLWARNDQHAYNLAVLLGFENEARRIERGEHADDIDSDLVMRPFDIPGQDPRFSEGLPQGRPVLDGVTGRITWDFGCEIQRAVYELLQERWRAMICEMCGKYFVAMKPHQKLCSGRCSAAKKTKRALDWYHEEGKKRRVLRRAK